MGAELGALIQRTRPEHPHFDGPSWRDAVTAAGGWTEPREIRVTTSHAADPERVVDHVASISWVAGMPEPERSETLAEIDALVNAGDTPDELPVHVVLGLTALAYHESSPRWLRARGTYLPRPAYCGSPSVSST